MRAGARRLKAVLEKIAKADDELHDSEKEMLARLDDELVGGDPDGDE